MKARATLKYLRMAPRKVRLLADLIRGKNAGEAKALLSFAGKLAAEPMLKTLDSAIASARQNFQGIESNLVVSRATVDEGPKLKRFRPRAKGMAYPIEKKTSHITIVVQEIEEGRKAGAAATKEAKAERLLEDKEQKTRRTWKKPSQGAEAPKAERAVQRIFRRKSI